MSDSVVLRCVGVAGAPFDNPLRSPEGQYLREFDPEFGGGVGRAEWTRDKAEAMVFPSIIEAHGLWTAVPKCHPVRDDGRPNRPLTAFSVTFEDAAGRR